MQQDLFTRLIEKYLAKKASRQEIQLLEEYYTRLGRKEQHSLTPQDATALKNNIFSELQARIHSSGTIKDKRIFFIQRRWLSVAAVFCVIIGTGVLFLVTGNKKENIQTVTSLAPVLPLYKTWQNTENKILDTFLTDGTHIWLNQNSSLRYPVVFTANERKVELTGEAYFEVVHNASQPFRVKAGNALIEDLGTKFNVKSYATNTVQVTLTEGLLKVNNISLVPGQQYTDGKISNVNVQPVIAWIRKSETEDRIIVFKKFPEESTLALEDFMTVDYSPITNMYLLNDSSLITFLTKPQEGDYFFNQYSLGNKKLVSKYIKSPAGHGIGQASFSGLYKKKSLWMFDFSSQYLITDKLGKSKDEGEASVQTIDVNKSYYSIQLMDSLKIVATGSTESPHEIQELELAWRKETADYGSLPDAPEGVPFSAWKDAHQSFIYIRPTEDKIVTCARFTDEIKIFDRRTKTSVLLRGPENFPPDFAHMKPNGLDYSVMIRNDKTRIAFQKGAVTEKYIYLLYSGNKDEHGYDPNSRTRGAGKFIYVYDWNGNPVKKFALNRYITNFTVSDDDSIIYANYDLFNPKIIYKTKIHL